MDGSKRIPDRRQMTRRVSDILRGSLTEEERQHLDRLMYKEYMIKDRRTQERRLGVDRECEEK